MEIVKQQKNAGKIKTIILIFFTIKFSVNNKKYSPQNREFNFVLFFIVCFVVKLKNILKKHLSVWNVSNYRNKANNFFFTQNSIKMHGVKIWNKRLPKNTQNMFFFFVTKTHK